jgi:hypothetical protein
MFVALALPVSFSILSIKTAGTLWMMRGVAQKSRDGSSDGDLPRA